VAVLPASDYAQRCTPGAGRVLRANFSVQGPALDSVINHTLHVSDNMYAEVLARRLGVLALDQGAKKTSPAPQDGHPFSSSSSPSPSSSSSSFSTSSTLSPLAAGLAEIRKLLVPGLVPEGTFFQADGSGVSRRNLITGHALHSVLTGLQRTGNGRFFDFLPLAGVSGTLAGRFLGTPLAGNLRAKTGTLTGTSALAGSLQSPGAGLVVFSIVLSQTPLHGAASHVDDIALLLYAAAPCEKPSPKPATGGGCGAGARCGPRMAVSAVAGAAVTTAIVAVTFGLIRMGKGARAQQASSVNGGLLEDAPSPAN
jgi:hypothetical protein